MQEWDKELVKQPVNKLLHKLPALGRFVWRDPLARTQGQPGKVVYSQTLDQRMDIDLFIHLGADQGARVWALAFGLRVAGNILWTMRSRLCWLPTT